jgi:hypothetical protein
MSSGSMRRGGIPGPESRTGLTRPSMTEAEFERRIVATVPAAEPAGPPEPAEPPGVPEPEIAPRVSAASSSSGRQRSSAARVKPAKPRRVQRMFAIEEDLDKKLWLYAIHIGKDRSEVINDLLRPIVASMVLYDSRDRRGRNAEPAPDRGDLDESAA